MEQRGGDAAGEAERDAQRGREAHANRRTIASYEDCAADYARSTAPLPTTDWGPLERFVEALPPGGAVLEIGSGPGWDADWLERAGVSVRRTDATRAFVELQHARGKRAELLDVVGDDLGGPYGGVVAMYVLQHIDRHRLPKVVARISHALVQGGAFLFAIREGNGDAVERRSGGGSYYVAEWSRAELNGMLRDAGLRERWSTSTVDSEGRWINMVATKEEEA